ncbi:MAG: hypothetical protein QNJ97_12070 [Myxococcota bacterium]|nr:hypothetical protein [Myxococcota bacterium]
MDFRTYMYHKAPRLKKGLRKQLIKIKVALDREAEKNSEMIDTYRRYVRGKATDAEMAAANEQFREFLKTMGLGVLTVLPFSPVTIPVAVNLGKKFGIDILPSSFRASKKGHKKSKSQDQPQDKQ